MEGKQRFELMRGKQTCDVKSSFANGNEYARHCCERNFGVDGVYAGIMWQTSFTLMSSGSYPKNVN